MSKTATLRMSEVVFLLNAVREGRGNFNLPLVDPPTFDTLTEVLTELDACLRQRHRTDDLSFRGYFVEVPHSLLAASIGVAEEHATRMATEDWVAQEVAREIQGNQESSLDETGKLRSDIERLAVVIEGQVQIDREVAQIAVLHIRSVLASARGGG